MNVDRNEGFSAVHSRSPIHRYLDFRHLMRMDRPRILRRPLQLKLKIKRPMGQPKRRWFNQVLEYIKNSGKMWQEIGKERLWEDRRERLWEVRREWRLFVH
jgi:hypothetical protein